MASEEGRRFHAGARSSGDGWTGGGCHCPWQGNDGVGGGAAGPCAVCAFRGGVGGRGFRRPRAPGGGESRPRCGGELFLRFGCAEPASFVREGKVRDGAGESPGDLQGLLHAPRARDEEMVRAFHAHSVDVAPCGEEGHDGGPECEGGSGGNPAADRS